MPVTAAGPYEIIIKYRGRLLASGKCTWEITTKLTKIFTAPSQIATWLTRQWVMEVPEDLAFCEFECHKTECQMNGRCQRRLSRAGGELMPAVVRVRIR